MRGSGWDCRGYAKKISPVMVRFVTYIQENREREHGGFVGQVCWLKGGGEWLALKSYIPVGPVILGWGPSDTSCSESMLCLNSWSLSYGIRLYFFNFLPPVFQNCLRDFFETICCLSTVSGYLFALIFLHPSQILH